MGPILSIGRVLFLLICLFSGLWGCNGNSTKGGTDEGKADCNSKQCASPSGLQAFRTDTVYSTISFFEPSVSGDFLQVNNTRAFGYIDIDSNRVNVKSLNSTESILRYKFPYDSIGKVEWFLFHPPDTLFLMIERKKQFGNELWLYVPSKDSLINLPVNQFLSENTESASAYDSLESILSNREFPMYYKDGKLILQILPWLPLYEKPEWKRPVICIYDIGKQTLQRLPVFHPQPYYRPFDIGKIGYHYAYYRPFVLFPHPDTLMYAFKATPWIYRFALSSGQVVDSFQVCSQNLNLSSSPPPDNNLSVEEVIMQNGEYGPIVYDPVNKLYYRMVFPKDLYDNKEMANFVNSRTSTFVIFKVTSSGAEVICETKKYEGLTDLLHIDPRLETLHVLNARSSYKENDQETGKIIFSVFKTQPLPPT